MQRAFFLFLPSFYPLDFCYSHKFQSTPQGISLSLYIYIYIYRYIDIYNRHIHTYYSNLQNGHRGKFRCSVFLNRYTGAKFVTFIR